MTKKQAVKAILAARLPPRLIFDRWILRGSHEFTELEIDQIEAAVFLIESRIEEVTKRL
jgi:hypothetical protein